MNVSGLCGWFPCVRVSAKYAVTSYSHMYMGVGLLHPDYNQYITLPQCSYTACDGSSYEENEVVIRQSVSQWIDAMLDQHKFDCYASADQIIIDIAYGFSAGFNSIFWPLMFSSCCLLSLIVHLAWYNSPGRRRKRTATRRGSSRRSEVDGDGRPNLHRRNNMVATGANGLPSILCRNMESLTADGAEGGCDGLSGGDSSCSWKHDYGAANDGGEVDLSVIWTTNVDGLFHATAPPAYGARYDHPPPSVDGDDDLDLVVPPPPYPMAVTGGDRPSWRVDFDGGEGSALPSADGVDEDVLHRRSV